MDKKSGCITDEFRKREKELDALYTLSRILMDPEIREDEVIKRSAEY